MIHNLKVGTRLRAAEPGRYVQIADRYTPAKPEPHLSGAFRVNSPEVYWMDITEINETTFTYDSYVVRAGFIDPCKKNRVASLDKLLQEIELKALIVEET
jgi:hypothetical protein